MLWALLLVVAAVVIVRRFGAGVLSAILAAVWLAGAAGLWRRHAGGEALMPSDLWVPAAGLAALGAGYAALIGRLKVRSRKGSAPGAGLTAPRPQGTVRPSAGPDRLSPAPGLQAPDAAAVPDVTARRAEDVPVAPADPTQPLGDAELDRYARHIVLRELGGAGQRRLRAARVLVVGAGGLGAPVLMYLAAAGVGRITVADDDTVGLSNLQRQVIFSTADIGRPKVQAAAQALGRLNPHVGVTPLARRIGAKDTDLVAGHDLVIDGTDSFASRQAVNAACVAAGVPLLAGAIAQWEGQVGLYDPARGGPCLACLFPESPAPGLVLSCAEAGVVGALPGVIGGLMALEAIKELAGIPQSGAGASLRGRMLIFDGLWGETRVLDVSRRPGCPVCHSLAAM